MLFELKDSPLKEDPRVVAFILLYYLSNYLLAFFSLASLNLILMLKIH